jgi:hypothetical protein
MLSQLLRPLILLLGLSCAVPALALEALSEAQLGEVSGAGIGFFVDNFLYEQGAPATAQIGGIKDSAGNAVTVDLSHAYIKGEGSRRGQDDVLGNIGSPLHPFTFGPRTLPGGIQALQLKTPTYSDPLNDTHQYGLWASYQGCVYGEAGCTNANSAVSKISTENAELVARQHALEATYNSNFVGLKNGIETDLILVNQRQAEVNVKASDVGVSQTSMASAYTSLPATYIGWSKPALGEKYSCGLCLFSPATINTYNARVDSWKTDLGELDTAQTNLSQAWAKQDSNGVSLTQRKFDYDKYAALCGTPTAAGCAGGSVARGQANLIIVNGVAVALNNGGTRVKGLDLGLESTFTLPSVAHVAAANDSWTVGATTNRTDHFNLYVDGLTLHGAYLNIWGDANGFEGEASLQVYANRLALDACNPGACNDSNRAIAKNVYFDLNLGNATYQPLSFKVDGDGHAHLLLPKVTWANHEGFYQNVQKSNISVGNLTLASPVAGVPSSVGSQVVQGIRLGYFDFTTHNLPR